MLGCGGGPVTALRARGFRTLLLLQGFAVMVAPEPLGAAKVVDGCAG